MNRQMMHANMRQQQQLHHVHQQQLHHQQQMVQHHGRQPAPQHHGRQPAPQHHARQPTHQQAHHARQVVPQHHARQVPPQHHARQVPPQHHQVHQGRQPQPLHHQPLVIPGKEKKDKNAPKRNWTAYAFYVEENRAALKQSHPDATFGQISKIAAAQWASLPPELKHRYEVMAANDKHRYDEEMKHYVAPPGTKGFIQEKGKKKVKKDKNAPKGPLSAYFIFTAHIRPTVLFEHPELNLPGITKEIANRWRNLTPEEKEPFEEKSRLDKLRYEEEMKHYVPPPIPRGYYDEKGKKKHKKDKNAPKNPLSAYFIFSSHIRPSVVFERPDLSLPGVTQEIANRWRQMTPEQKLPFEEKSRLDKERYHLEMAAYKAGMM